MQEIERASWHEVHCSKLWCDSCLNLPASKTREPPWFRHLNTFFSVGGQRHRLIPKAAFLSFLLQRYSFCTSFSMKYFTTLAAVSCLASSAFAQSESVPVSASIQSVVISSAASGSASAAPSALPSGAAIAANTTYGYACPPSVVYNVSNKKYSPPSFIVDSP